MVELQSTDEYQTNSEENTDTKGPGHAGDVGEHLPLHSGARGEGARAGKIERQESSNSRHGKQEFQSLTDLVPPDPTGMAQKR